MSHAPLNKTLLQAHRRRPVGERRPTGRRRWVNADPPAAAGGLGGLCSRPLSRRRLQRLHQAFAILVVAPFRRTLAVPLRLEQARQATELFQQRFTLPSVLPQLLHILAVGTDALQA